MKIRKFFDAHCHFRSDSMLSLVVPISAKYCRRAVAMGNLTPAIKTAEEALDYRLKILRAVPDRITFWPLMSIMFTTSTTPKMVREAASRGIHILKLIPRHVSTNSEENVPLDSLDKFAPVLEAAQECGMYLSGHWESLYGLKGQELPDIDREIAAMPMLNQTIKRFPGLKMVVEHVSTAAMLEYLMGCPQNVAATLTAHHAMVNYEQVFNPDGSVLRPHGYCKPVVKHMTDMVSVRNIMTRGNPRFFLGSDSAPHPRAAKECTSPKAGIFSAPVLPSVLMQIFSEADALNLIDGFTVGFGERFYNLPPGQDTFTMIEEDWVVPQEIGGVVPWFAGQTLRWKIAD